MCTNYVPTRGDQLQTIFGVEPPTVNMREQAWPGYLAPIIRPALPGPDGDVRPESLAACFGLIPGWSRDGKNFRYCYNARSETVASKPSFRDAWRKQQRCIIPADAFFEPNYETGRPVRWRISAADGEPLALAGIWEAWRKPPGSARNNEGAQPGPPEIDLVEQDWLISFSMLTINADQHALMNRFHAPDDEKRSVVMLSPDEQHQWLYGNAEQASQLFHAFDADRLTARPDPAPPRRGLATAKTPPAPEPQRRLF